MSQSLEALRRKISGAGELESVASTMKSLAAASIAQYENAVLSLDDYYRTVELGLAACFRNPEKLSGGMNPPAKEDGPIGVLVFGSDQGLVGQFNDVLADFVASELRAVRTNKIVWAVGERVHSRLADSGLPPARLFTVPISVTAITPLVGLVLTEIEPFRAKGEVEQVYIFHNRPKSGAAYESVSQRLLPLDEKWRSELAHTEWPTRNLPEVMGDRGQTLLALIREYLFVSLFRACAESLASENTSRLAAMQRAEKNIDDLLDDLTLSFNRFRQQTIDEELFDVISGFEALSKEHRPP